MRCPQRQRGDAKPSVFRCWALSLAFFICAPSFSLGLQAAKSEPALSNRISPLTAEEQKLATIAWKYFENNTQPETGLVNAVDKYPSTTMWDAASYLGGLVSAVELGIISKNEFDRRMTSLLNRVLP
jgi:hypothetical protein